MEGDNGQDIGHTLIFGFRSSLFRLSSLLGVYVRCVSWSKERPSSTELARGTKWRRCFRSWRSLARTSTLKVRLSCFLRNLSLTVISLHSHCLLWGFFGERLTLEREKKKRGEKK